MFTTTPTTAADEKAALTILQGDYDEGGIIPVYVPREQAHAVLEAFGWRHADDRWFSPSGERYWQTDEALQVALVAIAVSR